MGPLSGKERRAEGAAMTKQLNELEAHRIKMQQQQELHDIKVKGEALKYGVQPAKPMSTREEVLRIQAAMPKAPMAAPQPGSTDTVPAMLTPGEAVIPVAAAQNPANKGIIAGLVQEGRDAGAAMKGLMSHFLGEAAPRGIVDRNANLQRAERQATGFEEGTTSVPFPLARSRKSK